MIDHESCCRLIQQLVEIESYSGQEAAAVKFLVGEMTRLEYSRAAIDQAGNAIGIRNENGERTIILLGHIDTVPGQIPVRIEQAVLYGRGSVDAKGPLAAFALAGAQASLPPTIRLVVCGAVEEESATSIGARQIARDYRADCCLIGEPSGVSGITLGYKGRLLLDYEISVNESHTAGPESTAAEKAVEFWNWLQIYAGEFNQDKTRLFDQLLLSLRQIRSSNDGLVDRAAARIGCRLPPDFEVNAFLDHARNNAGLAQIEAHGHEVAIASDRSNTVVRALARSIREHDLTPTYKLKTGTSDMNVVGPIWKCPIAAYGPGDSLLDHTPNEHLRLDEFLMSINVLKTAIEHLAVSLDNEKKLTRE